MKATDLAKYLKCDLFVIGGAKTYATFTDWIDAWIVTKVPIDVADADVFMPSDFLDGLILLVETREIGESLKVETFRR
jgi:dihydrofolate reductase